MRKRDETTYSKTVRGAAGNYGWPVRFDHTDGYIGINQTQETLVERVLLSPAQVRALLKFIAEHDVR